MINEHMKQFNESHCNKSCRIGKIDLDNYSTKIYRVRIIAPKIYRVRIIAPKIYRVRIIAPKIDETLFN